MRYTGVIYRPPSEANSIIIQCTIGCPHNMCTFCPMYKDVNFRIRSVAEIKKDLQLAQMHYGDTAESLFFADGNTILMKTDQLMEILAETRNLFPGLQRITMYGSARYINMKSLEELQRLKDNGLSRIHSGMESGDDIVLARIQKGATAAELVEAGAKVKAAGIELSEYVLIGIGGRDRTRQHAIASANVLNKIDPTFIRVRTFIPIQGTPLYDDYCRGLFGLLTPYEALRETALFVNELNCNSYFYSDHYSNYAYINGRLPVDKQAMLVTVNKLLTVPEDQFRPPAEGTL